MNHSARARGYEKMARLSTANLGLADVYHESAEILATALPHDAGCWHTMDPATLIETSLQLEGMSPRTADVAEFAYVSSDYNSFAELARGPQHSGVLSDATEGRPDRSLRYRELMRPSNLNGELRAAFVVDGASWGCFAFFREGSADFTEEERDFTHELAPLLGRSFRRAGVRARTTGSGPTLWPGVVMLGGNRRVESLTAPARRWLEDLGFRGEPGLDPLPFPLLVVAERVRDLDDEADVRVLGESGRWIQVHASPASGDGEPGRVAIILQAAASASIAPLISAAYGFTPREREVADLVLQGRGTSEIAARLFISPYTVQGHLKSIFRKAGIRSRRELVGRVFIPHNRSPRL